MFQFNLINRIIDRSEKCPNKPAFVEAGGRTLTYSELVRAVNKTTKQLEDLFCDTHNAKKRLILNCANVIEFPIWFLSALKAGAQVLVLCSSVLDVEVVALAKKVEVEIIIADESKKLSFADTFEKFIPAVSHSRSDGFEHDKPVEVLENWWGGRLARRKAGRLHDCCDSSDASGNTNVEQGAVLLSSSGSTGSPRIVLRDCASIDAMAQAGAKALMLDSEQRVLAAVPLAHSYGMENGLLFPLQAGATVLLCDGLNSVQLLSQLKRGAQVFPAVPAMVELLPKISGAKQAGSKLSLVYSAGAPLPQKAYDDFYEVFGLRVGQIYGMSEIGSVTFNNPNNDSFDPSVIGTPMSGVKMRLLDKDESGQGELVVCAPSMLKNYVGEKTEFVDGFFPTGDMAQEDDRGSFRITGRKKLLIDIGGRNVNPLEVENVLSAHPMVLSCAVVPVRQSASAQRIRAVIVPKDIDNPPAPSELRNLVGEHLAKYKIPRLIEFSARLPRLANGKIDRVALMCENK